MPFLINMHKHLVQMFHISKNQAKAVDNAHPDCQLVQPPVSTRAVNPQK